MSKKLKKKIESLCGLIGLDWEARQKRAEQILSNNSWKQQLCNDLQGLSFRDLELHLESVVTERQKKEEGEERKLVHKVDNEKLIRQNTSKSTPKLPPRTLAEILHQVHSPRVGYFEHEESGKFGPLGKKPIVGILSDTSDDDTQTGE